MIYYFSATGNCKYVANKIAEETGDHVLSIAQIDMGDKYTYSIGEDECIGFVFPTYFYGFPTIVEDFLGKLELTNAKGAYIYLILTCGTLTGGAGVMLEKLLAQKGYSLSAQFSVQMVDNYVPVFKIPTSEKIKEVQEKADKKINEISNQILQSTKGDKNKLKGFASPLITRIVYSLYKNGRKTTKFYATDNCDHCGLCQSICPCQAILVEEGKPKWVKERCTLCLGCLHRCPKAAIQYGKNTQKRGQYINPDVKL